ncbi:MAG: hypothetical protein LBC40_04380 [Dysgonamonadaceae bacterium]|jgi:hypothetical protein|nr:hypothetical protein [Dysgonamonadaceae bacterium]
MKQNKVRMLIISLLGAMAICAEGSAQPQQFTAGSGIAAGLPTPVSIYCNWSAYDEMSDSVRLTEALAMRELNEILRLRKQGVRVDYYLMDAFWYEPKGGYRSWRKADWPDGPDRWLEACKANHLKPGLWFSANRLDEGLLELVPEWENSLAPDKRYLSLFEGNYLDHLMETLQLYADKGIKLFKFDFAGFGAATAEGKKKYTHAEIVDKNRQAFMQAIRKFRSKNPDVIIISYNGFGGYQKNTITPFSQTVDLRSRWLEIFDAMYCGDPRLSDLPMMNFWRSKDLYSDHMVRQYLYNGVPLSRIDNFAVLLGTTGTCYRRGIAAWKGTLILSYARGGWLNSYNGNLELLSDADAAWFATVQRTFLALQQFGHTTVWGDIPGTGNPYGYRSATMDGSVFTVVNPGHEVREIDLPEDSAGRVLFHDKGFRPAIRDGKLLLGPEQLAVVGFGRYASAQYDWGVEDDVIIPQASELLPVEIENVDAHSARVRLTPPQNRHLHVFFTQCDKDGHPLRSWGGAPPNGIPMNRFLTLSARQGKKTIPLTIEYDKMIWSGLSWAAGEIDAASLDPRKPLEITCTAKDGESKYFRIEVYAVRYE